MFHRSVKALLRTRTSPLSLQPISRRAHCSQRTRNADRGFIPSDSDTFDGEHTYNYRKTFGLGFIAGMATYAFAQKYFANARMLKEFEREEKRQHDEEEMERKRELDEAKREEKRKRNEGKSNEQLQDEFWREHYIQRQE